MAIVALVAALATAGCGGREAAPPAAAEPVDDGARPVQTVVELDVGRTFDGVLVTVLGEAATAGWSSARLRLRTQDETPGLGILAFDLVAQPPDTPPSGALAALPAARRVQAALPLPLAAIEGVGELRVHGEANAVGVRFR